MSVRSVLRLMSAVVVFCIFVPITAGTAGTSVGVQTTTLREPTVSASAVITDAILVLVVLSGTVLYFRRKTRAHIQKRIFQVRAEEALSKALKDLAAKQRQTDALQEAYDATRQQLAEKSAMLGSIAEHLDVLPDVFQREVEAIRRAIMRDVRFPTSSLLAARHARLLNYVSRMLPFLVGPTIDLVLSIDAVEGTHDVLERTIPLRSRGSSLGRKGFHAFVSYPTLGDEKEVKVVYQPEDVVKFIRGLNGERYLAGKGMRLKKGVLDEELFETPLVETQELLVSIQMLLHQASVYHTAHEPVA